MTNNEIIIDEEFKYLMPPLGDEARSQLAENLQKNGCLHALVLWEGILIDGYNRYEICKKHNIPFKTVDIRLPSRDAVKLWIIELQSGRRNLTPMQLTYLRGLHYRTIKKLVGNENLKNPDTSQWYQNETIGKDNRTSAQLAEKYRVSRNTIMRDAKVSEAIDAIGNISQDAKKTVLSDEAKIEKKTLEKLAAAPSEDISEIAESIENGTYKAILKDKYPDNDMKDNGNMESVWQNIVPVNTLQQKNPLIADITGIAWDNLINACSGGDKTRIKKALRAHIDVLEELYAKM